MQWSRLLHSWSSKEATGDGQKKSAQKAAGWATAHLSHDTMDCIVTQGWGGWPGRRGLGHDRATARP